MAIIMLLLQWQCSSPIMGCWIVDTSIVMYPVRMLFRIGRVERLAKSNLFGKVPSNDSLPMFA